MIITLESMSEDLRMLFNVVILVIYMVFLMENLFLSMLLVVMNLG